MSTGETAQSGPNSGDTVYFFHSNRPEGLGIGELVHPYGAHDYQVRWQNAPQGDSLYKVRKFNLFTLHEVVVAAYDMFPEIEPAVRDFTHEALARIIADPEAGQDLAIRLTPEAIEKNLNTHRTVRDLGYVSSLRLIGDETDPHSNISRLQRVLREARSRPDANRLNSGFVELARFDPAGALIEQEALDRVEQSIIDVNRETLDRLYQIFGADFEEPAVFERYQGPHLMESRTIRRLRNDRAFFVERGFHRRDEMGMPEIDPYIVAASLYIGEPDPDKLLEQKFVQVS